jgi:hypothetical protein
MTLSHAERVKKLDKEIGKGPGDWIQTMAKPFARLLGKKSCSSCQARRLAANAYAKLAGKYGHARAMVILKDLFKTSMNASGDEVVTQLNRYLNGTE